MKNMEAIFLSVMIAVVLAVLGFLWRLSVMGIKKHSDSHELLEESNKIQIQATLLFMFRHAKENGNMLTLNELALFKNLYMVYKKLGGNDFIEEISRKINKMKINIEED